MWHQHSFVTVVLSLTGPSFFTTVVSHCSFGLTTTVARGFGCGVCEERGGLRRLCCNAVWKDRRRIKRHLGYQGVYCSVGMNSVIGVSSALASLYSLEAETRFAPLSYFWICWNVTPAAAPRAV